MEGDSWPLVILIELRLASGGGDREAGNLSPLPPPSSPWVWGTVLVLALRVGALACWQQARRLGWFEPRGGS